MGEQRNIHTTGIVLRKHSLGENDFSVTIYSPDLGKIQATAKGARKMTSSVAGHIETLNLCRFQLYKSAVRYTIVQCQAQENFKNIRKDFDRSMLASLMVEIFHKSTISSEHSFELFELLEVSLRKLSDSEQHFLTIESFKLNLLRQIGTLPDLEKCASCHERWRSDHKILLEDNGHLSCLECLMPQSPHEAKKTPAKAIDFSIIKLIHYLTLPQVEQTKKIALTHEQKEQLQHITRFFLQHFLDREILSERIVSTLG